MSTPSPAEVIAEALAKHCASGGYEECSCGYGPESYRYSERKSLHLAHQASVIAALAPAGETTRGYSAAYRNLHGDIVPVGVTYSKRAWAEDVRIEWQRDEPEGKYFIAHRDVPAWQETPQ